MLENYPFVEKRQWKRSEEKVKRDIKPNTMNSVEIILNFFLFSILR